MKRNGTAVEVTVVLLGLFAATAPSALAQAGAVVPTTREALLAELPAACDRESVVVSPDGRRIAFVQAVGGKQAVVVDGAPGTAYDGVAAGTLTFSPDSRRLLYVATRGGKALLALQGAVQTRRYHLTVMSPGGKAFVVVDGKELREADGIDAASTAFSPDSQRVAYLSQVSGKWSVIVDERDQVPPFDDVSPYQSGPSIQFSPDSRRIAYVGLRREPDDSKLGYRFLWSVVVDGKQGTECDQIGEGSLRFSPDSKHLAYVAVRKGKECVVRDGAEEAEYAAVEYGSLRFSDDGSKLGYVAARDKDRHPQFAVIGAEAGMEAFGIVDLTFSPDGRRLAYNTYGRCPQPGVAIDMAAVIDGKPTREWAQLQGPVYFSRDGKRVAYVALPSARRSEGKKSVAIVDDVEGTVYRDIIAPIVFSADGMHVAYRAVTRSGEAVVVVDGAELTKFEAFVQGATFGFGNDGALAVVGRRGERVYRVDVTVPGA